MASFNYTRELFRRWQTIILFGLLGLVLALIISFIQPLRYSSTVRLLILQDLGSSVDAYTASRSEERIAENLSTIVYTSTFFDQVFSSGFQVDTKNFPKDDIKRRREWARTVDAAVSHGTGLLTITAYHTDVTQAEQLVRAIAFVLTQHVKEYTSGGSVQMRLVDAPLSSQWPVKPNILANIASGFFLGGLVGVANILLHLERIRRRHQFVHEE
jgi:capsular polysaccharide biosynthesis protein